MEIVVTAELHPTEDPARVLKALENVFPSLDYKQKKGAASGSGAGSFSTSGKGMKDLEVLKEHLKQQLIRSSARGFLLARIEDGSLSFGLNKQAAYMGKISFVDFPIALGPISVDITEKGEKELEELVEWLCGE